MAVKTKTKKTVKKTVKKTPSQGGGSKGKTKTVTNLIIIDASGSMEHLADDVKGGLKQTFFEIKQDGGKYKNMTFRTVVADFSDDYRVLVDSTNPQDLTDTLAEAYKTRGSTALFDAIGRTFAKIEGADKNVFVTIFTDGQENASKEFEGDTIKKLIAEKKKLGWAVTFVGSTEAAMSNTSTIGVSRGMSANASFASAVGQSFSSNDAGEQGFLSKARSVYYAAAQMDTTQGLVQKDSLLQDAKKESEEEKKKDTK